MELLAASLPAARSPVLYDQEPLVNESGANRSAQNQAPACTRFIEEGIRELIKARRILCGSYVYGFYLEDNGYNKTIFEYMQVSHKCNGFNTNFTSILIIYNRTN